MAMASKIDNDRTSKACNIIDKTKKVVWVPKGSQNIKAKVNVQASTARAVPNAKPKVTFKQLLVKYEREKASPSTASWFGNFKQLRSPPKHEFVDDGKVFMQ